LKFAPPNQFVGKKSFLTNYPVFSRLTMTLTFLKKIKDTNYLLELIRVLWAKYYADDPTIEPPLANIDTMLLEKMSRDQHTVFAIFNLAALKIDYIGENCSKFSGYEQAEFLEKDFLSKP
jgi:hypothetical protein